MAGRATAALALAGLFSAGKPLPPRLASSADLPPQSWDMPFENHGGLIILRVAVNGGPGRRFVLDTGAGPCVISTSVADAQRISHRRGVGGVGGGGRFQAAVAEGAALSVAGRPIHCNGVWVADLSAVGNAIGTQIDGVIGSGFFAGSVITIDYRRNRVSVGPRRAGSGYSGAGQTVPLTVRRQRPYVSAVLRVGDRREVRQLLVDTGSQDVVDDSLLLAAAEKGRVGTSGLGPGGATVSAVFDEVRIGVLTLRNIPGVVPNVPIIGAGLLSRFRVVLDYDGGWMALEPPR